MVNDRSSGPRAAPIDLLELGVALVAARPLLRRKLRRLGADPRKAEHLMHLTLRAAWNSREVMIGETDLENSLVRILRTQILH